MEGLTRTDSVSDGTPIPAPTKLKELNLTNFFSIWNSIMDQNHFCEMLTKLQLTSLAIDGNMVDQSLIDTLTSDSFCHLGELKITLGESYRRLPLPYDDNGEYATKLDWSGRVFEKLKKNVRKKS